jgi:hypothetical protein
MKNTKFDVRTKKLFLGTFIVIILFSMQSCVRKEKFLVSTVVPAARGYSTVKKDKNKNYIISIQLLDLAEVVRLQPTKKVYVAWIVTDHEVTQNIGRLNSAMSHSKKLVASLEATSPFKPVKIFITAEDDANVQFPNGEVVLSTNKFKK